MVHKVRLNQAKSVELSPSFMRSVVALPILAVVLAVLASRTFLIVPPGHVAIPVKFGAVESEVLDEGLHVVAPWVNHPTMSIRRQILEMSSGGGAAEATSGEVIALSREQLPLTVDIGFPYSLNPETAAKVYQRIGQDTVATRQLLRPAARSAVRDAVAKFSWSEAAVTRRDELAKEISAAFTILVRDDLAELGFSRTEASGAFNLMPVQLRRVLPPQAIQNSIAQKLSAEQDFERQGVLFQIAEAQAARRSVEGAGLAAFLETLPASLSPLEIAALLMAMADKTRSEALLRAVEGGAVATLVLDGSGRTLPASIHSGYRDRVQSIPAAQDAN